MSKKEQDLNRKLLKMMFANRIVPKMPSEDGIEQFAKMAKISADEARKFLKKIWKEIFDDCLDSIGR